MAKTKVRQNKGRNQNRAEAPVSDEIRRAAERIGHEPDHDPVGTALASLFGSNYSGTALGPDAEIAMNALTETRRELFVAAEAIRCGDGGFNAQFGSVVGCLASRLEHIETVLFASLKAPAATEVVL